MTSRSLRAGYHPQSDLMIYTLLRTAMIYASEMPVKKKAVIINKAIKLHHNPKPIGIPQQEATVKKAVELTSIPAPI